MFENTSKILGIFRTTLTFNPFYFIFRMVIKTDIAEVLNYNMKRTIKPDVAPGEYKCRTCDVMWSSFMDTNSPCTDTTIVRNGLHDFDFATRIIVQPK